MMFYAGNGSSIFLPWTGTQKATQSKDSLGYKHRTLGSKVNTMEQNEQIWRSNHRTFLASLGISLAGQMLGRWAQYGPAWTINENQWLRSPRRLRQLRMSSPLCKGAFPAELKDLSISVSNSPFGTAQRAPNLGLLCWWQSNWKSQAWPIFDHKTPPQNSLTLNEILTTSQTGSFQFAN